MLCSMMWKSIFNYGVLHPLHQLIQFLSIAFAIYSLHIITPLQWFTIMAIFCNENCNYGAYFRFTFSRYFFSTRFLQVGDKEGDFDKLTHDSIAYSFWHSYSVWKIVMYEMKGGNFLLHFTRLNFSSSLSFSFNSCNRTIDNDVNSGIDLSKNVNGV